MVSATEAIVVVISPADRNGRSTRLSLVNADDAGDQERDDRGRQERQAEPDIGAIAGERADGRVRRDREIGKAQHRVDRGEADGRRGKDRAGHDAVEHELDDISEQRPLRASPAAREGLATNSTSDI